MGKIALQNVDAKSRKEWRPHFALLFNQAVGGANSQAILAVWYAWITRESGETIHGNNPMNLTCGNGDGCYDGQIGWYQFPGNSRKFAAFATPQAGARAVAGVLTISKYRYPPIVKAARADDWQSMVDAIMNSCWVSCTHQGYGGTLGATWNQMRKLVAADVKSGAIGDIPAEAADVINASTKTLGAWNDQITFEVGHKLTAEDVDYIMATLDKNGWFDGQFGTTAKAVAMAITRGVLEQEIGHEWNKELQERVQRKLQQAADLAGDNGFVPDPLKPIAQAMEAIVGVLQKLLDPQTYVRTGAFIVGLILAFSGFKMLMDSTSGGGTPASV